MINSSSLMTGKRGVIMGIASDRSIAWGIARTIANHGAQIALTYQNDILLKRIKPLAETLNSVMIIPCDVTDEESIDKGFEAVRTIWDRVDFLVHALAYSDKTELEGKYLQTSRENFARTLDISCYSLTAVCQRIVPLMSQGGSIVTLTYIGSQRVIPHYNVMGIAKAALEASVRSLAVDLGDRNIRVNAISAGPIKTLAASGIGDFRYILKWNEYNSPLHRNVTIDDVGGAALYLLSDLSPSVTGEILHVDSGYHTVGMVSVDAVQDVARLVTNMATTYTSKE